MQYRHFPLLAAIALIVGVAFSPGGAQGDLIAIGDPVAGNSWGQKFKVLNGDTTEIDEMRVLMIAPTDPAVKFEAPAFRNFSTGSWTVSPGSNDRWARATTSSLYKDVDFYLYFTPEEPMDEEITFLYQGLKNNTPVERVKAEWKYWESEHKWKWGFTPDTPGAPLEIPEAPVGALLLAGLGLLGVGRRRK